MQQERITGYVAVSVPKSVSWVALIVAGGLALLGLRLSQRE